MVSEPPRRSRKKKPEPDAPAQAVGGWSLGSTLVGLLLVVGLLAGLIGLGRWSRQTLESQQKTPLTWENIEVATPPGISRAEFFEQVRYYAQMSGPFDFFQKDLEEKLKAGFESHPWVEKVQKVERLPPRRVKVEVRFRVPVLAVRWEGKWRAVDAAGVLLPRGAETAKLPRFEGTPLPPKGPEGTPWGDPVVEAWARKAAGSR